MKTRKKATAKKVATKGKTKGKVKAKAHPKKKAARPKKVSPIPEGASTLTPYVVVRNGKEAIEFYKKALGAKEKYRIEGPDGSIGHCELKIGDSMLMLADEAPEYGARGPESIGGTPVCLHIYSKDVDKAVAVAVAAGMKELRPVSNEFYGERLGKFMDPYGHIWSISSRIEILTPKEMRKRAEQMFGGD